MRTQQMLGSATVVGVLVILFLIAVGIARHSASVQGTGSGLLWVDVALLLTYGIAGIWVSHQMAVDRGQRNFQVVETSSCTAA